MRLSRNFLRCFRSNINYIIKKNLYTKQTQMETSKSSCLKCTRLKDLNENVFNLFQKLIKNDEIQYLNQIFTANGYEIRMAGGAVRDILCQITPNDIDFASDAKPDEMIKILSDKPDVRLITTQAGTKHGTVTARIRNISQYEITTLRVDVNTDGRHAEVEFINDWKLDASRRDLTINSMFIDLNGILYDYFDGVSDLKNRRIRFVGDADKRMKEDYLRIFRYFRFHTRFGQSGQHDQQIIGTMKKNLDGLQTISGERIWYELKRILININCIDSIEMMFNELKIGKYLGFINEKIDLNEFYNVQKNLKETKFIEWKVSTLFASLISDLDELASITNRLKLSNNERDTIGYILMNRLKSTANIDNEHFIKELQKQIALSPKSNQKNLKEYCQQYLLYYGFDENLIKSMIIDWCIPVFPFNGTMLFDKVKNRKQLGIILERLRAKWAEQNYQMNEEEFLKEIDKIIETLNQN